MENATTKLFVAGLLVVLPVRIAKPNQGQAAATVCRPSSIPTVSIYVRYQVNVKTSIRWHAIDIATRAFERIGVRLDWHEGAITSARKTSGFCIVEIIELQLDLTAPDDSEPDALAYAKPMSTSGTRVHVFYDRVAARSDAPNLLGYVLAHEIGHVLQGVVRHSDYGILKAKWDGRDYGSMAVFALTFLPADAEMIQSYLKRERHENVIGASPGSGTSKAGR